MRRLRANEKRGAVRTMRRRKPSNAEAWCCECKQPLGSDERQTVQKQNDAEEPGRQQTRKPAKWYALHAAGQTKTASELMSKWRYRKPAQRESCKTLCGALGRSADNQDETVSPGGEQSESGERCCETARSGRMSDA